VSEPTVPPSGTGVFAPPTRQEAFLLARYTAGVLIVERIAAVLLLKWLAALAGVLLLTFAEDAGPLGDVRWLGVVLLVAFWIAWLAQWGIAELIHRIAVPRRYRPAVEALESAREHWWPRLRAEVDRVGLRSGRFATLGLIRRWALRRLRPHEREPVGRIEVRRVVGTAELRRARELVAAPPPPHR
jgi:hypothetical protein